MKTNNKYYSKKQIKYKLKESNKKIIIMSEFNLILFYFLAYLNFF